jgi:competence protein ComEC
MLRHELLVSREWRAIGMAALVVIGLWVWAFLPRQPILRVTVLDVGQGDAIVVRAPGGETALVDSGPGGSGFNAGEKTVLPYLRKTGVRSLDAVVLTHPHEDHVAGMASVLRALPAKMLVDCGAPHASPGYAAVLKLVEEKDIPYHVARRGDEIRLGEITLKVLNPPEYRSGAGLNDRSVVLKVEYGETSILLAADAEREAEMDMLANCKNLQSTVLKVGHHGAEKATSEAFLDAVRPEVAIVSVGRNAFGHPSRETLDRFKRHGVRVYRTDRNGGVTIESDGKRVGISVCKETPAI